MLFVLFPNYIYLRKKESDALRTKWFKWGSDSFLDWKLFVQRDKRELYTLYIYISTQYAQN